MITSNELTADCIFHDEILVWPRYALGGGVRRFDAGLPGEIACEESYSSSAIREAAEAYSTTGALSCASSCKVDDTSDVGAD